MNYFQNHNINVKVYDMDLTLLMLTLSYFWTQMENARKINLEQLTTTMFIVHTYTHTRFIILLYPYSIVLITCIHIHVSQIMTESTELKAKYLDKGNLKKKYFVIKLGKEVDTP